ncbi:hypothetical protein FKM82_025492 [Ascaphus truei]|uniref:selenoprotein S isoform X2 n=1 Tax=Ascaphus truei TaxID=8439 RepID=UPI003F59C6EE
MELGDGGRPGKPGLEPEWGEYLQQTVGSAFSSYGWYILFGCIVVYLVIQKLTENVTWSRTDPRRVVADPSDVVKRQEAVAAARLRMQEELNSQAERYKEKQKQLEEEKRRNKIESWESMKEGKSYKVSSRLSQPQSPSPSTSASPAPKPKPERRPLRGSGECGTEL